MPSVILINDSIAPCLDPQFDKRLVLTLILGTFTIIGLSEKNVDFINFFNIAQSWPFQISLSNGKTISENLRSNAMKERDDFENCDLIAESAVKILKKYYDTFTWQPECMVILSGNANVLKHVKSWPNEISHVKMITITDYDESIKCRLRGALFFAKNK